MAESQLDRDLGAEILLPRMMMHNMSQDNLLDQKHLQNLLIPGDLSIMRGDQSSTANRNTAVDTHP